MMERGYSGKEEFVRSRLANDISRSEHLLFYPIMLNRERGKQVYTALTFMRKERKISDSDVSEELIARTAARLSGIQIGQEYWEDAIEKAILENSDLCERYLENYEDVEAAAIKPMGGLSYAQKQPFAYRLYPPAEREVSNKGKKLGLALLGIIAGGIGIPITVNYFTGFLKSRWLPINPNADFDGDGEDNGHDPNPYNIDADGDMLLDGRNIILTKDDPRCQQFLDRGIIHRKNSNDSYIFFGERSLGSDPLKSSPRAVYQAKFLAELEDVEYEKVVKNGLVADFDWDKDFLDNWFEIHGSETDPLTPNDRYVIWLRTSDPEEAILEALLLGKTPREQIYNFLVDWERIPPKNIKLLEYKEATLENFEKAIYDVRVKADKNDFVYICINTHGNKNAIGLYNNYLDRLEGLDYEKLDELVDTITDAKTVTILFGACYSSWAREPLKDGPSARIVAPLFSLDDLIIRYIPEWREIYQREHAVPSGDDDGFVSIGEATRDYKIRYGENPDYDIMDTQGVAFKTFFGDYIIGEKDHREYKK